MLKFLGLVLLIIIALSNFTRGQVPTLGTNARAIGYGATQPLAVRFASSPAPLRVEGDRFVDSAGRIVLLRGINVSGGAKVPPFSPVRSISDLDSLPALGFNVIRLVFIWEAFERSPGVYNLNYLNAIRQIADAAWSRGMYVIIDLHQDGFSRFTAKGSGDGFPSWAVSMSAKRSTPDNGRGSRHWQVLMAADPAVHRSFADFYRDENGVRTRYLAMVDRLSREFSNAPGVIGYDLLNEPLGRERDEIGPLYHDAAHVIRVHHPTAIMFVEGHVSTNCGLQTKLDRPTFGNFAYAPHFYDPVTILRPGWRGRPTVIRHAFVNMVSKADEWDVPLFLGEFGVPPSARSSTSYINKVYDRLDEALASGAQWNFTPTWNERDKDGWNEEDFNILGPDGRPRSNFQARPYPRATAGVPLHFEFRKGSNSVGVHTLEYVWQHHPSRGSTELYLPQSLFSSRTTAVSTNVRELQFVHDDLSQTLSCSSSQPQIIHLRLEARLEP